MCVLLCAAKTLGRVFNIFVVDHNTSMLRRKTEVFLDEIMILLQQFQVCNYLRSGYWRTYMNTKREYRVVLDGVDKKGMDD